MPKALKTRSPRASRTKQLVEVNDLTGGVDLRRSPTLLDPSRARKLLNYSLEEPGALVVRPGFQRASSGSLGAGRAQGGQRVYLSDTVFSVLAFGGAVYKPDDSWVFGSPVYSTISATNQVYFPYDRDLVAVMDGANRPRKSIDGTTWTLMGIDAPSSAAALSSVSTGGLTSGSYAIAYSYKDRALEHESNVSAESTITLSASSGALHAAASPSTDAQVDAYVWYARHVTPDGESVLRKVSSGSASTITITSSNWTTNDEAPTNHNVPPDGLRFGTSWKNRWWAPSGTVGNRLHFTEIFQPQSWPSLFFIDIPFEKGDNITAIQPLGDTLLVYGQSGIFLIVGQTSLDFEVRPSQGAETGSFGQRLTARVEQEAIHADGEGINAFNGAGDRSLEHDIGPAWQDLQRNTASADLEKMAMVYEHQRHEVRLSTPRIYPTGASGEWVLNLDRSRDHDGVPAWTTTDRDIALYIHWNGNEPNAGDRGRLFFLPSSAGIVFEENVEGAGANSSNMTAEYEGPALSLGLHRARVTGLHIEYEPHGGAFTAEVITDGVSQGSIALNIGAGLYAYGSSAATYGTATYGGAGRRKVYTPLPMGAEGRTVTLKTVYVGTERFKKYGYAFEILPEPEPRRMGD